MSTSAPPPPPPGGNEPGKDGPTHAVSRPSPPTKKTICNRGDGSTAETAYWSTALLNAPSQAQYLVYRRNQMPPYPRWMRCTLGEARYEAETGYAVWELGTGHPQRVHLLAGQPALQWHSATEQQMEDILQEEVARVTRHETVSGEDLLEGQFFEKQVAPIDWKLTSDRRRSRG